MTTTDFPIYNYPTKDVTDPDVLFQSLGSFWTQLFQERGTIKGLTAAQALEITQRYKELVETIHSFSVKDIPIFNTIDWLPLIIKKSEYNTVPLLFKDLTDSEVAYFGPQPAQAVNNYYEGITFQFGYPKNPSALVYTTPTPAGLTRFSVIADKIINPSKVFVHGIDVQHTTDGIYFNHDIFSDPAIIKIPVINDDGTPETFVSITGPTFNEELVILWIYQAQVDQANLFENFGYIFDLKLESSDFYKVLLGKVLNLFVEGPTIHALKSVLGAFLGVSSVINPVEHIETIFTDANYRYVVTDLHTYKFDLYYSLLPGVAVGATLYAGDMFVDAIQYFDYVVSKDWWRHTLVPKTGYSSGNIVQYPEMAFPSHMFLGDYEHQFVFLNAFELVTTNAQSTITFPIHGDANDVAKFHNYINLSKVEICAKLGLGASSAISINPLDFIFSNFLKANSALIKFNFKTVQQAQLFTSFFETIKKTLPKYVYFIFFFDFTLPADEYAYLNYSPINADGSESGGLVGGAGTAYNKIANVAVDLFAFSKGVDYASSGNETVVTCGTNVKAGTIATFTSNQSTKDIPNLRLIDYT